MKNTRLFFLLAGSIVIVLGALISNAGYQRALKSYQDSLSDYTRKYQEFQMDSSNIIKSISASDAGIKWNNTSASSNSSTGAAYLSASQGIEVQIQGLSWNGYFLDNNEPIVRSLRDKFNAVFTRKIDELTFDPDFQQNGYPDLFATIENAPSFYKPTIFSELLGKVLDKEPKPFKSYELKSCDHRKALMNLWLVTFDLTFRIEPSADYSRNSEWSYNGRHPITKERDEWSRRRREFKGNDTKYGNLALFLEFKPKNNFYLAQSDENNLLTPGESPKMGVGAVECIYIQNISEKGLNHHQTSIGVKLAQGKSLSLYPSLNELKDIYAYRTQNRPKEVTDLQDVKSQVNGYESIIDRCENAVTIADPSFFNSSKYAAIELNNMGSWNTGSNFLLSGKEYTGDYYAAKFLIHLYVIGEWTVKDQNLIKFKERKPARVSKLGILSYLLPDFGLGSLGRFFGGALVIMVVVMLLSFFFPPLKIIINKILSILIGH